MLIGGIVGVVFFRIKCCSIGSLTVVVLGSVGGVTFALVWALVEFRGEGMVMGVPLVGSREGWTTDGGRDDSRNCGGSEGVGGGNTLDFCRCSCRVFGSPSSVCPNEGLGWPL